MRWILTTDAELNRLYLLENTKSKEIAAIEKAIEKTENDKEEIQLLQRGKELLIEQSNLLGQIADRTKFIKSKSRNHAGKTITKI